MKKVIILTAAYGEGHNTAARALETGFEVTGCAEAKVVDAFGASMGVAYQASRQAYLQMIDRTPLLWAGVYALIDQTPLVQAVAPMLWNVRRALKESLALEKPDAVISTYPLYNYLLDRLPPRPFPQFTVVTDSISINSVWYRCRSDLFFVPNAETARVIEEAGIDKAKLRDCGFPVAPRFATARLERPVPGGGNPLKVLFMINAEKGRAPALVERLLKIEGIELTVTAGRDEGFQAAIRALGERAGRPIEVHGWTQKMPELLMTHHLLIGKAGGAAVQETIAARTPMIITKAVPGQEEGNARLLVENGCGAICTTPEATANLIEQLLENDARGWREWEAHIARMSRPDAAMKIAQEVSREIGR